MTIVEMDFIDRVCYLASGHDAAQFHQHLAEIGPVDQSRRERLALSYIACCIRALENQLEEIYGVLDEIRDIATAPDQSEALLEIWSKASEALKDDEYDS